ncbi:MAG: preprotein translocase subunit SecG [Spirochaetes bacterium]|jgi:preprotein translocase subunit SecG|nr:preprotein translocase subunit SecG [Spirochaetota bacterium]
MGVLVNVLTVLFLMLCVLVIIIILLQSDKSAGIGIIGGSSQSAFGSSTADIITKITAVMIGLFMVGSFGLAVLESHRISSLEKKLLKTDEKPAGVLEKDERQKASNAGRDPKTQP